MEQGFSPDEFRRAPHPLAERLVTAALNAGQGEATTEGQYVRALAFLEAQRLSADPGAELEAVNEAVAVLTDKLERLRHPEQRR